jgi:hypothetical protein
MIVRVLLILIFMKFCFTDFYRKEINIYDTENSNYYQMINRTLIEQINKHPFNSRYSLVDCFVSQVEINTGKTFENRKMAQIQLNSACLTTEIPNTIGRDEMLQLFSYLPSSTTLDGLQISEDYLSKREEFSWINFDSDQILLDKTETFVNMTQFLCNSQNKCGNLEMVMNEKEGFHCFYKLISNQIISSNFTFVICRFNHSEENKIYEVTSSKRINSLTGEWEGNSYYFKRDEVYEKFDKSDHQYIPNMVVNRFASNYRKWINDAYPPNSSPVDPSQISPINPSQNDPEDSRSLGAGVILLIVVICLAALASGAYAIWKFYFKKRDTVSLNQFNTLLK